MPFAADLPPAVQHEDVPIACIVVPAAHYKVPLDLMLAVLKVENGRTGTVSLNRDGSQDLGPFQINDRHWMPYLRGAGVSRDEVVNDGCVNAWAATWIMARCLTRKPFGDDFWRNAACYHSMTRAPRDHNGRYARLLYSAWSAMRNTLPADTR